MMWSLDIVVWQIFQEIILKFDRCIMGVYIYKAVLRKVVGKKV